MSYDLEILAKIESGDYICIDEPENRWGTVSDALEVLKSLKECILEQDIDTKYLYMRW
ncbi:MULTISPECIES: hypothetical protein [Streptococcus]|uniref:hypothetical protein n=1 Tax=Streptococcus TaxID=1301 RepID=UPI001485A04B|nr:MULTISPECIES: hypothetical protein [Streptococcus]HEV5386927.1 hypothetical protein [Streptococcus pneumoniae]